MRHIARYTTTAALLAASGLVLETAQAQKWELGVTAGGGFYTNATVTSPAGDGKVGFKSGPSFGAIIGSNPYRHVGGELRYEYRRGDLKVSSGGTQATFNGDAHAVHYDFLIHMRPAREKVRPYVAAGAGVKIFRGIGKEVAYQPLNRLALLTRTTETKGMASVGAGVKIQVGDSLAIRLEFRDLITPFPRQVIAPSVGANISGWLHDFVPMVGITYTHMRD